MTANNPLSFRRGARKVARLFPVRRSREGLFPPHQHLPDHAHGRDPPRHLRDPWVALTLYKALCPAKDHSYHLLADAGSPKVSLAWLQPLLEEEQAIIGPDWYPYGIGRTAPASRRCCNTRTSTA